jgi:hypothetical protein
MITIRKVVSELQKTMARRIGIAMVAVIILLTSIVFSLTKQ